jgi:hypothetical protein
MHTDRGLQAAKSPYAEWKLQGYLQKNGGIRRLSFFIQVMLVTVPRPCNMERSGGAF